MTVEQRFERIEADLAGTTATLRVVGAALSELTATISRYIDANEARLKRIEENLDGLIRAITADHSNGKGKH